MWDNPRLLNLAAGALCGVALFIFALSAAMLIARSPLFPVVVVELTHAPRNTGQREIEAAVRERVVGNFFAVDPAKVRDALEALPWVRRASVRRVWPDRLQVTLEEHEAFARWGEDALVSVHGERFRGTTDEPLPVLVGPKGSEQEVVARFLRFVQLVAPLGVKPERVVLTPRRAWEMRLDNGLQLMLGRDADHAEVRLSQFVAAYPATLGVISRRHEYVDLRYPNGFALRVPELEG